MSDQSVNQPPVEIPVKPVPATAPLDNQTVNAESQLMSVSVRGWLVLMVLFTVCLMSIFKIGVSEPLYSMSLLMVGFYFGQNKPAPPPA